jgi:hypothetical protein
MSKYFSLDMTIEEIRKHFRVLCLKLHPDKGGDAEEFKAMKSEYDRICGILAAGEAGRANKENREARFTAETEKELREAIERFLSIPGIILEICGSWLWITGNTFPVRERIYLYGAKYSKTKKCWYWAADMGKGKVRGIYSMDKIRNKFGSTVIESEAEERKELAA